MKLIHAMLRSSVYFCIKVHLKQNRLNQRSNERSMYYYYYLRPLVHTFVSFALGLTPILKAFHQRRCAKSLR